MREVGSFPAVRAFIRIHSTYKCTAKLDSNIIAFSEPRLAMRFSQAWWNFCFSVRESQIHTHWQRGQSDIWKELGAILARANPLIIITCPRADRFSEKPPRLISCPNQQCSINQAAARANMSMYARKISALCISNKITLFTALLCARVSARANIFFFHARRFSSAAGRQKPFFCPGKPPDRAKERERTDRVRRAY